MVKLSSPPAFPSFLKSRSCRKLTSDRLHNPLYYSNVSGDPRLVLGPGVSIAQRVVPADRLDVSVLFGILGVQLSGHKLCSDKWQKWAFLFTSTGCDVHSKLSQQAE